MTSKNLSFSSDLCSFFIGASEGETNHSAAYFWTSFEWNFSLSFFFLPLIEIDFEASKPAICVGDGGPSATTKNWEHDTTTTYSPFFALRLHTERSEKRPLLILDTAFNHMDNLTATNGRPHHITPPNRPPEHKDVKPVRAGMPRLYSHWLIGGVTDEALTVEDYLDSRRAQRSLVTQVTAIAERLSSTPEDDDNTVHFDSVVHDPRLSVPLFDFLTETHRLPEFSGGKRIIYQLDANELAVEIMPSFCHDTAAAAITSDLLRWAESGGAVECLDICLGSGTILPFPSLISLAWLYDGGSKKSPDNSFTPSNIQSPPGKTIGTSNVCYPNFTVEVAKSHETWDQLVRDADSKHFAIMTGVMVYLGIKIFPSKRMRICVLERNAIQGFGYLNPPLADTGFIDINNPCNITIVIPKRLIFFGVPPALVPPTVAPDYNLDVDIIRRRVLKYWDV